MRYSEHDEWLEADGLGGFASGTATGVRTRRYHALLLTATTPPTGRMVLVNGFDAWVENAGRQLHSRHSATRPTSCIQTAPRASSTFSVDPWPTLDVLRSRTARARAGVIRRATRQRRSSLLTLARAQSARGGTLSCGRSSPGATTTRCITRTARSGFDARATAASASRLAAVRRRAAIHALANGDYHHRARLVPELPVRGGARARPRLHRGPRGAGRLRLRTLDTRLKQSLIFGD